MVKVFSFERASICAVIHTLFHPHPTHFLSGSIFTTLDWRSRNPSPPPPRLVSPVREAHHLRPQSEDQSVVSGFEKKKKKKKKRLLSSMSYVGTNRIIRKLRCAILARGKSALGANTPLQSGRPAGSGVQRLSRKSFVLRNHAKISSTRRDLASM